MVKLSYKQRALKKIQMVNSEYFVNFPEICPDFPLAGNSLKSQQLQFPQIDA